MQRSGGSLGLGSHRSLAATCPASPLCRPARSCCLGAWALEIAAPSIAAVQTVYFRVCVTLICASLVQMRTMSRRQRSAQYVPAFPLAPSLWFLS